MLRDQCPETFNLFKDRIREAGVAVRDQSGLYAYEITNFVNGMRTVGEIRDAVSAEYGPLPMSLVLDYLNACAEAGVIQWR